MNTLPHTESAAKQDVFLYGRNSSDDQAEAGTIKNQQDFLRNFSQLYRFSVLGDYWDEGVSSTVPLADRPYGRLLLEAARERPGAIVLCYRLDRLGRSLRSLLDAHDQLERAGVTIRSATEPFDTSTPIGRFLFQLLASLAELEKCTIAERTSMGRERVARQGKWTGGPIPFGYDLDDERHLIPSSRPVDGLGLTEADVARSIFERLVAGSSTIAECRRLNDLKVPTVRRYAGGTSVLVSDVWGPSRISGMVKSSVYVGQHVIKTKSARQ